MDDASVNLLVNAAITVLSQVVGVFALRRELRLLKSEHDARLKALEGGRRLTDAAWEAK